ncbi:WD40 repeat-like protein [Atractiella rhizophila]|nr:WD40 repeat-like protein [Atractiella rhizophila]
MNLELLNTFAQELPEFVESSLDASALIARFNPRGKFAGHFLAVGRSDGCVSIIDLETKGIVRFLEGHVKAISAISWSRNGRHVLSASRDWNVIIWDLKHGERSDTIRFDAPVSSAEFHPQNRKLILVTLALQSEAVLVDLTSGMRWELDVATHPNLEEGSKKRKEYSTVARFTPTGDFIYVGTSQGNLRIFDANTKQLVNTVPLTAPALIKTLRFDKRGSSIVTNSSDRSIRVFGLEKDFSVRLDHRFQDLVNKMPWTGCGFSTSGDYVVGGAGDKAAHNIHIWDRAAGVLVKMLEGPPDPFEDFDWHPTRPVVASVSNIGLIHIWSTSVAETWAAYAPGFEELEENVEYEEREDEFDIEDTSAVKRETLQEHISILPISSSRSHVRDSRQSSEDEDEDFLPTLDHVDEVDHEEQAFVEAAADGGAEEVQWDMLNLPGVGVDMDAEEEEVQTIDSNSAAGKRSKSRR